MTAEPRGFASDNRSGAHPEVMAAIARANEGHAPSYGDDGWTERVGELFREHFGVDAVVFPVFNGTAANTLVIDALTRPHESVICAEGAHIDVDEAGAPERWAGVKLIKVPTEDGKLRPGDLGAWEARRGDQHHNQPRLVSISQATEVGTVYTAEEIRALAEAAHELGMLLHVDGARIANAAASLGIGFRELIADTGVDALSFGATKNGGLIGDAVVFLRPGDAEGFEWIRKQGMQLASKMRFLSAQLGALLDGDLWLRNASHANSMALLLAERLGEIPGVELAHPVEANGVFARVPASAIEQLEFGPGGERNFWVWDAAKRVVRLMCSWDTTEDDVREFAATLARIDVT